MRGLQLPSCRSMPERDGHKGVRNLIRNIVLQGGARDYKPIKKFAFSYNKTCIICFNLRKNKMHNCKFSRKRHQ